MGVIDPIDPRAESAEEVRDRALEAADILPVDRLGTTDDCGFSPFADDTSTSRDVAFDKIRHASKGLRLPPNSWASDANSARSGDRPY